MREAIGYYGITAADLGLARGKTTPGKPAAKSKGKDKEADAPAAKQRRAGAGGIKFRDDAGNAWSGFGPKPRWLTEALASGKTLEELKA
jgi:DNA-binding protein H-NS